MEHNNEWLINVEFRGKKRSVLVTFEHKDDKGVTLRVHGRRGYQLLKFVYEENKAGQYPIPAHWEFRGGVEGKFANEKESIRFSKNLFTELNLLINSAFPAK